MQERALDCFNMGLIALGEGQPVLAAGSFAACIIENDGYYDVVIDYLTKNKNPLASVVHSMLPKQIMLSRKKLSKLEPVGMLENTLKPTIPFAAAIQDGRATGISSPKEND